MAKRMTATDIWSKEWFMILEPRLKCLVRFIWDNCDNAGVWSPNWTLASLMIGEKVTPEDIKKIDDGDRHEILKDGKIWIKDFIKFQCGNSLNEKSPPHKKIIDLLHEHSLYNRVINRVSNTLKEIEKEIEIEKEKEKEKEKESARKNKIEIVLPYNSDKFRKIWKNWIDYKRTEHGFKFKSIQSEQAAANKLNNMAETEAEAIEIIMESMANGWKGFFNLQNKTNETNNSKSAIAATLKKRGLL